MKIPDRVKAFILGEAPADRRRLIGLLERIQEDPLIGTYLAFPYQPGTFGITLDEKYFITYRTTVDGVDLGAITRMLDFETLVRYLQEG